MHQEVSIKDIGEQSHTHRKSFASKSDRSRMDLPASPSPNGSARLQADGSDQSLGGSVKSPIRKQNVSLLERTIERELEQTRRSDATHGVLDSHESARSQNSSIEPTERPSSRPRDIEGSSELDIEPERSSTFNRDENSTKIAGSITPANDHIETLTFHPEAPDSDQPDGGSRKKKESKLVRASKAILLFKRATSSQNEHAFPRPAPRHSQFSGFRSTRSFVASFWRPNNFDDPSAFAKSTHSFTSSNTNNSTHNPRAGNSSSMSAFLSASGGASGTNNRAGPEGADKDESLSFSLPRFIVPRMNALKLPIVCLVRSLDGELMREIFIHRYELGQYLMDDLKVSLGIKDSKYFGLKMVNATDEQEDVQQPWLDPNESVYKQIIKCNRVITVNKNADVSTKSGTAAQSVSPTTTTKSVNFYLRIKFYPPNLARVQDTFLKNYLWLQLRRDLRLGKLTSSMNNLTYLMACVLQYELGDYKQKVISEKLPSFNVLPNQDLIEQQATEIWQNKLQGTKKHLVLMQFLRASVILETYGFDYYPVRDHQRQRAYLLGFNYAGVKTIRNGRIVNYFRWHNLSKISYERRMIIFHIYPNENSKRKQILGFKCLSNDECQNLYLRLLEQKYFFTVDLTYFDKSIRKPSHLTESSVGHLQQQQLAEWSSLTTPDDPPPNLTTDWSYCDDGGLAEDEENDGQEIEGDENGLHAKSEGVKHTRGQQSCDEVDSSSLSQLKFHHYRADTDTPKKTACDTLGGDPAPGRNLIGQSNEFSFASSSQMSQQSDSITHSRAPTMIKSSSLQESDHYDSINCHQSELRNFFSHSGCPQTVSTRIPNCYNAPDTYNISSNECYQSASTSSSAYNNHDRAPLKLPLLQRQCSILKYSPECELLDANERPNTLSSDIETRYTTNSPYGLHQTINDKQGLSTGQRLVDWTERFITQPASVFASPSDCCRGQQECVNQAMPQTGQQQRNVNTSNDIFMQGIRCCLLILLLNFLLKLSDGLSGILVELLTFREQPASSASSPPLGTYNSQKDS